MKNLHFNSRITEVGDVANRLAVLYKGTTTLQDDAFLKNLLSEVQTQGDAITEAIKKDKAVSKLEDADAERDEAIRVLDKMLKAYEVFPVENTKAHGQKIATIFKKYGVKITEENYSSESNLIDSLLKELSASEVQASVTALSGVSEAIAQIRTTQEEFARLRLQYEEAFTENLSKVSASSLRKPLLGLINKKLIPYLVAMTLVDGAKYTAFADKVAKIIDDMNEVVKARGKKK
ncbi:DUF6261 family protein [Capnocytophaga canimorsus]|uniref:Hemagglutinin protein HagB n=1 Tax=Capnocytophaga canimorsus (strain 5) TaxID=860228 RepID=F9YT74_CAPCC|nr:DUF6261 family protein [Capnocytophaga canimorsus]AEK23993.1 Conserved hypothetical protein [Capnocytophaga canimorsus Cc5]WGU68561.1 DUF6261 family protein [Capnocytophaga canimorsus]WGU70331.1 DUF6261 family protein [Capnocytophaga canimorsus]